MRRTLVTSLVIVAITVAVIAGFAASGRRSPGATRRIATGTTIATPTTTPTTSGAPASTTTSTAATTTTTRATRGSGRAVTLAFGGDVHFEGVLRPQLLGDADGMLAPIAPVLEQADVAMVNLETAVTERGSAQSKQYVFRAPPLAFDALRGAGVDVATMANNHGMDYGTVGLADSLAAAHAAHFPLVGIGADEDAAYDAYRVTVKGQRIAFIGATQVLDDNLVAAWTAGPQHAGLASAKRTDRLLAAVRAARASSDTVVVYVHWGTEGQTCPQDRQRTLAQLLVDAGADVVVGSHAHREQGAGRLGGAVVDYGLGNFVFYADGGAAATTGVLTVTVTGRHVDSYAWTPALLNNGVPHPLSGDDAMRARTAWSALRGCTGLAP